MRKAGQLLAILLLILTTANCRREPSKADSQPHSAAPIATVALTPSPAASSTVELAKLVPVGFSDITVAAGIRFRHNNGASGKKYFPEYVGSGCAFFDYDNDGWQDILLINAATPIEDPKKRRSVMALYHNNQNGTFTDVTVVAGLAKPLFGIGVAAGDYDNDGWIDVFITALGGNRLFRNSGDGKFVDVTSSVGLAARATFSTSAAWLDYDKDGRLDLFVCNYVDWSIDKDAFCSLDGINKSYCPAEKFGGQSARLFRNLGAKFEDVTNVVKLNDPTNKSLGVVVVDYDRDGWSDLLVTNDTEPNKLYHNNGRGQFTETAGSARIALDREGKPRRASGADAGDFDRSGFASFAIAHQLNGMLGLYHSEGKAGGLFVDEAPDSNIGKATLLTSSFGLFFFDFDLDGWLDLLVANDDVGEGQVRTSSLLLFRNEGKKTFIDVSRKVGKGFQRQLAARGTAYADYDNDGDLDVLVSTNGGQPCLLRNEGGNQNRFVRFRTIGTVSNRSGIGTKITVFLPDGTRLWNYVRSGSSYCSQSELEVTFGLGRIDKVTRVEIEWPSGKSDRLSDLATNQLYTVKEGIGISR